MSITSAQFDTARKNLSLFILRKALQVQKQVGFGYVDSPVAPDSFDALMLAWNNSKKTRLAFPVWNGCSDNTIYTNPGVNYAFRFWHDAIHACTGLGFNTADEIAIGRIQVETVQAEFGKFSIEAMLMYADTIAQSQYAATTGGEFPANQLEFVRNELESYFARLNQFKIAA